MVKAPDVVGICGAGMMGSAFGRRLVEGGLRVITHDTSSSELTKRRIRESGLVDVGSVEAVVDEADVVLSIMGSAAAPVFAEQVAQALEASPRSDLTFADCNLIAPKDAVAIADRLGALGVRVVDAGICGAPPRGGHTPALFLSGPHTAELEFLGDHGFELWTVGEDVGAASALKVCSAAGWQGSVALITEVMVAARRYGLEEWLLRDLAAHQPSLNDWFLPAFLDAVPKAGRWASDMSVISRTLTEVGVSGAFHEAAAELYTSMDSIELSGGVDISVVVESLSGAVEPSTHEPEIGTAE